MHPLRRLFGYARQYRADVRLASLYSVLNKIFDVLPEVLIGIAVDVVVNRKSSFLARLGIADPQEQLIVLALITAAIWVGESLLARLLRATSHALPASQPDATWTQSLTERECQVASAVADGAANKEIARQLGITERTVKAHTGAIFQKLGVRDRLQLSLLIHRNTKN